MTNTPGNERRCTFASTKGGVMTEDAGAITGDLELLFRSEAVGTRVMVRYAGADEWYTVSGGPVGPPGDVDGALERIVRHLATPGPVVDGNERPVTLEGIPTS